MYGIGRWRKLSLLKTDMYSLQKKYIYIFKLSLYFSNILSAQVKEFNGISKVIYIYPASLATPLKVG